MNQKKVESSIHLLAVDAHIGFFFLFVDVDQGSLEDVVLGLCGRAVEVELDVETELVDRRKGACLVFVGLLGSFLVLDFD